MAFWEIGFITDEIIQEVKNVIEKGACVKVWTEEFDVKEGKARQKELEKLWSKINTPNQKIRKRKNTKRLRTLFLTSMMYLHFSFQTNSKK